MSLESDIEERLRETAGKLEEQEELLERLRARVDAFSKDVDAHFKGSNVGTGSGPVDQVMLDSMASLKGSISRNSEIVAQAVERIRAVT